MQGISFSMPSASNFIAEGDSKSFSCYAILYVHYMLKIKVQAIRVLDNDSVGVIDF